MSEHEQYGQDLTTGNIRTQLWSLAWPIMLSIFFYTLYNIVDTIWVGRLSAEAIAAVSISQISLFAMVSLSMGITVGSGVVISMYIGAKNKPQAERVLGQSFVLTGIIGLFFTVCSLVFREQILIASGASGAVFAPALEYFTIVALGGILMFVMMNIVFAFNAQGDSFTPTKLFAVSTLLNVILDPLLIFGWGPVPALGIAGAAYATLISQTIFILIAFKYLHSDEQLIPFRFSNLVLEWHSVKQVLTIGIPASLTQVIQPVGMAALMYLTAKSFHELGTIAFSIAFRIEFFAYLPAIGFGVGSMALIGQSVGAKNIDRAVSVYYTALRYSAAAAVMVGVISFFFAKYLIAVFTTDPTVVSYVTSYILIGGASYAFLAASMVAVNAFQAMGKSWGGFGLFSVRYLLITIPAAYLFTVVLGHSISGIWTALALGNVFAALIGFWWVRRQFAQVRSAHVLIED